MIERQGNRLLDAMVRGPLVMDAAMGTRLVERGLNLDDEQDGSALWNLTHPDDVATIHARDVAAGAEVLLTNTFLASRTWLEPRGYGNRVAAINRWAAAMAREAAGPDRFVVGSIGPTGSEDTTSRDYLEQAEALAETGVDALLFETHSQRQAAFALKAVQYRILIPRFVSLYKWPRMAVNSYVKEFEDLGVSAIGVNCMSGTDSVLPWTERLSTSTSLPLLVRPSGPSLGGGMVDERPEAFGQAVPAFVSHGARLIGGCCGTTDAHVAAIRLACYHSVIQTLVVRHPRRV